MHDARRVGGTHGDAARNQRELASDVDNQVSKQQSQPTYGHPSGSGLGRHIVGGVATGLVVGAGFMSADAIGRNPTGHHNQAIGNLTTSTTTISNP